MATSNVSKFRLILNGIGCAVIMIFCLPLCVDLAIGLGSLAAPKPDDPDGGKAAGVYLAGIVFCGLLGLAAFIDLLRTIGRWRRVYGNRRATGVAGP